jgi:hypothetical protein
MSEKPKRPWVRFHLSTAVALMVASGVFLHVNLREQIGHEDNCGAARIGYFKYQGWPAAVRYSECYDTYSEAAELNDDSKYGFNIMALCFDAAMALSTIIVIGSTVEDRIRRPSLREARKT